MSGPTMMVKGEDGKMVECEIISSQVQKLIYSKLNSLTNLFKTVLFVAKGRASKRELDFLVDIHLYIYNFLLLYILLLVGIKITKYRVMKGSRKKNLFSGRASKALTPRHFPRA